MANIPRWIKSRGINGEYGFINTKTGEFRTTLPNSVQEKKQEISKQRKAALRMHSARQAKFEEKESKRRNHSDETIKKTINIPIITMNSNGTFSNNYINSLAPAESSLSTEDPITEFYTGSKLLTPAFTAITRGVEYGLGRYGSGQLQNWARGRVISRNLTEDLKNNFRYLEQPSIPIYNGLLYHTGSRGKEYIGRRIRPKLEEGKYIVYSGGDQPGALTLPINGKYYSSRVSPKNYSNDKIWWDKNGHNTGRDIYIANDNAFQTYTLQDSRSGAIPQYGVYTDSYVTSNPVNIEDVAHFRYDKITNSYIPIRIGKNAPKIQLFPHQIYQE